MYDINCLIVETAEAGSKLQAQDGAMPAGHNGPHQHTMTPARNTSHWAITFLHAFRISGRKKFRRSAINALDLLLSPRLRPMGGAFWHRCHIGRNSFNGLIGQSWSMEALYYGWHILGAQKYRSVALEVFLQHVYDDSRGLWYQLDLDGSPLRIERTLNQQVWLAAMGAHLANGDETIEARVRDFLSKLAGKMTQRRNGLFPRAILLQSDLSSRLVRLVRERLLESPRQRNEVEVGYHLFTLTGLAQLFQRVPDHGFWMTHRFRKALNLAFEASFLNSLTANPYGFSYNVPGFELPYVHSVFRDLISHEGAQDMCNSCLSRQLGSHYSPNSHLLNLSSSDPETLAARFYEICRVPDTYSSKA